MAADAAEGASSLNETEAEGAAAAAFELDFDSLGELSLDGDVAAASCFVICFESGCSCCCSFMTVTCPLASAAAAVAAGGVSLDAGAAAGAAVGAFFLAPSTTSL